MFYGYPDLEYDGTDRTESLTEKNFNKTVFAKGEESVVFFNDDLDPSDPDYDQYECFLQVPDEPITVIDTDDDIDDFDDLADESTRVVGYFEQGTKKWEEFAESAEEFMGEVEFFTATGNLARKMGLQRPGEVIMYRPYESEPLWAPADSDTETEFEDWVEDNKEPIMEKLTMWNYFDVWRDTDEDHHMILAFVDEETDEGEAVLDILKEIVEDNSEYSGTLRIVLIDPDEHAIMVDTWEEMFDIDIEGGPQIGLVDISEKDGMWFNMDQLNLEDPEENADENEEVLQRWIEQILEGEIDIDMDDTEPEEPEMKSKKKSKK